MKHKNDNKRKIVIKENLYSFTRCYLCNKEYKIGDTIYLIQTGGSF